MHMSAVSDLDYMHILTVMVGQAKNGDHRARAEVMEMVEATAAARKAAEQPSTVQVHVGDNNQGDVSVVAIAGSELKVIRLLATQGSLPAATLAAECGVSANQIAALVEAEVIEYTPKGHLRLAPVSQKSSEAASQQHEG
jgi:hypothetical protein